MTRSHRYLGFRYFIEGNEVSKEEFEEHIDQEEDCPDWENGNIVIV